MVGTVGVWVRLMSRSSSWPLTRHQHDLRARRSERSAQPTTVRRHDTGVKTVHHPFVGDVTFTYESMELTADPDLTMFVYTPEPCSKSEQALNLLASWTAAPDEETTDADHQEQPRHSTRSE